MGRFYVIAGCALLPACLLFTSLDDASGGGDPSTNDASTNDGAATSSDASSGGSDASSDVASNPDARFCEQDGGPGLILCADFDGTNIEQGWTGLAGGAGELLLDQKTLLAKVPATTEY